MNSSGYVEEFDLNMFWDFQLYPTSFYEDIGNIIEKLPFLTLEQAELIISINDDNAILHMRMRYHI